MPLVVRSFLVLFGLLFVALGVFMAVFVAGDSRANADRAERLVPAGAAALASAAPGAELLVEGTVSPRNAALFRDFVAYVREEFRGADNNGDEKWAEDERVTPPMLFEAGGVVRLANEDYAVEGPHERWQEEGLNWSSRTEEGTKRYRGFVADRPAVAIGTIERGAEGNVLRAEFVYGGTRAAYIDGQRSAAAIFPWVGFFVGLAGAGVSFIGVWVLRRWR